MPWHNILNHLVSIGYPLPPLCQSQVLSDWFIRMVSVIQQEVGFLNIIRSNNAVRVFLTGKKSLDRRKMHVIL